MLYSFIGKLTPLSRGDMQPISFCRKTVRQEVASRNVLFLRRLLTYGVISALPLPKCSAYVLREQCLRACFVEFHKQCKRTTMLAFIVTPFKIDQTKNQNRSIDKVRNLGNETR